MRRSNHRSVLQRVITPALEGRGIIGMIISVLLLLLFNCIYHRKVESPDNMLNIKTRDTTSASTGITGVIATKKNSFESSTFTTSKTFIHDIRYDLIEEKDGSHKRFAAVNVSDKNNPKPISVKEWMECITSTADDNYSHRFIEELTEVMNQNTLQYKSYFFETKGVNEINLSRKQFEFVLVNSLQLWHFCQSNGPSPDTFGTYLTCLPPNHTCCAFDNLGKTSILISPKNLGDYSHIGNFMRNASKEEIYQLWNKVATEFLNALNSDSGNSNKSLWLSTSGLGVSWLHFRIDNTPKYYTYHKFARES